MHKALFPFLYYTEQDHGYLLNTGEGSCLHNSDKDPIDFTGIAMNLGNHLIYMSIETTYLQNFGCSLLG